MGRSIRLVMVALVAALVVAACGGKEEAPTQAAAPDPSTPQVVDDGTLAAGAKISAPKGEVVLTVSGDIGTANKARSWSWTLASLEKMRQVRVEAAEPFLKRRVTFEGVLLSDLLKVAGVPTRPARSASPRPAAGGRGRGDRGARADRQPGHPGLPGRAGLPLRAPLTAAAMTDLLGKTLADGGFYLPNAAAPVESLSG